MKPAGRRRSRARGERINIGEATLLSLRTSAAPSLTSKRDIQPMTSYPYTLEVTPAVKPSGHFNFAIRRKGKMVQRSDRAYPGEDKARERGLNAIERLLLGIDDRR